MQVDVLNHYRHALTHYFTLTLTEPYLQNSSHGTPYQKWALVVNQNFDLLSFAIHNLLRYTSRLVHEILFQSLHGDAPDRKHSSKVKSNTYTDPICSTRHKDKAIGIHVHDDFRLTITSIRIRPYPIPMIMRTDANGAPEFARLAIDATGQEREEPSETAEFSNAIDGVDKETVDIRERSRLEAIRERGTGEIAALAKENRAFGEICNAYYASRKVAQPFRNLNESYWV
jgi:hypothetical protein